MRKWTKRVLIIAIIAWGGYTSYDYYLAGYHTRPDMPKGAFSISYKNGMRAILVDVPNESADKRYLGIPHKVPFYLKDTWSFCSPPTEEEDAQAATFIKSRDWTGGRVEAICKIKVDTEDVIRGIIISVPKL